MSLTCGVDVGGTKILGGVVDEDGTIVEELRVVSPATDVAAIEDAITRVVAELSGRHPVEAVGIGAAGYIDKSRSVVMFAPNLAWRDLDLRAEIEARVDLPVVVENDANAAAWGEFKYGAGEDVDDLLLVTVGTGVGGGVVLDGRLHRGGFGVGGEVGHMRVVPNGVLCGCGNHGCLESYGSGSALVREARARSSRRLAARADAPRPCWRRPRRDHRPDGHRVRAGGRPVRGRAAGRSWAGGSAKASRPSRRSSTPPSWSSVAASARPVTCCSTRSARRSPASSPVAATVRWPRSASPASATEPA